MNIIQTHEGKKTVNAATRTVSDQELTFLVYDWKNQDAAMLAVLDEAPDIHNGFAKKSITFNGFQDDGLEFSVAYNSNESVLENGESKESTLNFDCTGSTRKMLYAYDTRIIRGPDPGNAIGWNGKSGSDMEIAGVDVPDGVSRETYSRVIKMSRLTNDYKRLLIKMRGCINLKPFKGWQKGEAMYLGATFQGVLDSKALITVNYNFQINLDESDVKIGGVNVGNKKGFEYLWAFYRAERAEGESPRRLAPDGVYLSQVARYADFGALGV